MLKVLDLFSGIGGFSLGLESTGCFQTVAFCENEPFCRKVLRKHWPNVLIIEDIHDVKGADFRGIHVVTGGFPCQDLSLAGKRAGLEGERSGLWAELFRIITEVRSDWAIVENVPGLRTLGADRVLADLGGAGYAAWPVVVGAVHAGAPHAGAPHRRPRVWIVAHSNNSRPGWTRLSKIVRQGIFEPSRGSRGGENTGGVQANASDSTSGRRHVGTIEKQAGDRAGTGEKRKVNRQPVGRCGLPTIGHWDWAQAPKPVLRGVDDGLSCGMDRTKRLKALGNAVVPQLVHIIGNAILANEE
jgi:DNA (cytosine-5)-methyltransferase 1